MEDALKGGPTNLAMLPVALPAARDAGGCVPVFPWQGPVTELLSMNLSNPFLNQLAPAVGGGALQCVWMDYFQ